MTWEGSKGLISARLRRISFDTMPMGGGDPAEPTTGRKGGESSFSSDTNQDLSETPYLEPERKDFASKVTVDGYRACATCKRNRYRLRFRARIGCVAYVGIGQFSAAFQVILWIQQVAGYLLGRH